MQYPTDFIGVFSGSFCIADASEAAEERKAQAIGPQQRFGTGASPAEQRAGRIPEALSNKSGPALKQSALQLPFRRDCLQQEQFHISGICT